MNKAKSKTEKKIDRHIREALEKACEVKCKTIPGFLWLTHQVNFTNFPASLLITCVFDNQNSINAANNNNELSRIKLAIQKALLARGIKLKSIDKQVLIDSEEACDLENSGDWEQRIHSRAKLAVAKLYP